MSRCAGVVKVAAPASYGHPTKLLVESNTFKTPPFHAMGTPRRLLRNGPPRTLIIPKPTPESWTALHLGYQLLWDDEKTDDLKLKQRLQTEPFYDPRSCNCSRNANKFPFRCSDDKCRNAGASIACPPECERCVNNPWVGNPQWAIGKDTYVFYDKKKGWGVKAFRDLPAGTWIGPYAGVLLPKFTPVSPPDAENYLLHLRDIDQMINPYSKGNSTSLINHSCQPNCTAEQYCVDGYISIGIRTSKFIKKGTELTFEYQYSAASADLLKDCSCGMPGCKGKIGTVEKPRIPRRPRALKVPSEPGDVSLLPTVVEQVTGVNPLAESIGANPAIQGPRMYPAGPVTTGPERRQPVPSTFDNLSSSLSEIARMLSSPTPESIRPRVYQEMFIHRNLSIVCFYYMSRNKIRVACGRITECFINYHHQYFYVIRSLEEGMPFQLYLPRFMVYAYREDAQANLDNNVYTRDDMNRMKEYLNGASEPEKAVSSRDAIVTDFERRFENGDLLEYVAVPAEGEGGYAIGRSDNVLNIVGRTTIEDDDEDETRITQMAMHPVSRFTPLVIRTPHEHPEASHRSASPNVSPLSEQEENIVSDTDSSQVGSSDGVSSAVSNNDENMMNDPIVEGAGTSNNENMMVTRRATQEINEDDYSPFHHMTIAEVREAFGNNNGLIRFLHHAVCECTLMALARLSNGRRPSYEHVYRMVYAELVNLYINVPPLYRKFLTYNHYLLAIENQQPGSFHLLWCPFCCLQHNFAYTHQLHRHFQQRHSIVAFSYTCPGCGDVFHQPSAYRRHVANCEDAVDEDLRLTRVINEYVSDAYSDYMAKKGDNDMEQHIFIPGIPNMRVGRGSSHQIGKSKAVNPVYEMDIFKYKPKSSTYNEKRQNFKIQAHYTEICEWENFTQSENPEHAPPGTRADPRRKRRRQSSKPAKDSQDGPENDSDPDSGGDDDDEQGQGRVPTPRRTRSRTKVPALLASAPTSAVPRPTFTQEEVAEALQIFGFGASKAKKGSKDKPASSKTRKGKSQRPETAPASTTTTTKKTTHNEPSCVEDGQVPGTSRSLAQENLHRRLEQTFELPAGMIEEVQSDRDRVAPPRTAAARKAYSPDERPPTKRLKKVDTRSDDCSSTTSAATKATSKTKKGSKKVPPKTKSKPAKPAARPCKQIEQEEHVSSEEENSDDNWRPCKGSKKRGGKKK